MPEFTREVFTGDAALLAEVPVCGRSDQRAARPGALGPHEHPDAFEICLIARGEVDWWVADRIYTVRSGQVFLTRPGEQHGGIGSVIHPCELYYFQLTRQPRRMWLGLTVDEETELRRELMSLPVRHFDASVELQRAIRAVVEEHRRSDQHARLAARTALHTALITFIREAQATRTPALSEPVRQALAWMGARIEEPFTIPEVAAAVNLSVVRLQARFKRELHCPMGEYRTRRRLHAAKLLLRDTDEPVTQIAFRLGFSSSQYFATVFRKQAGLSPSAYRAHIGRPGGTPA